jgi:hypothetical protein
VQGSIAGPVIAAKGSTFRVKTTLSPTGSSLVTATAKTTITAQTAGKPNDLRKGACLTAFGTAKGKTGGTCGNLFGPRPGGGLPQGGTPRSGNPPSQGARPGGGQGGFTLPANAGFAAGTITAVEGGNLTVKGRDGNSTTVTVSGKTAFEKTVSIEPSAIMTKDCAFVFGASADKGVTVAATNIAISKPVNGACNTPQLPRSGGPPTQG